MRAFHHPDTAAHDPRFFLVRGRPVANEERPRRADLLLEGLSRVGIAPETPPDAGPGPRAAVHSLDYLAFLETAWSAWRALPGAGAEVVANVHPRRGPMTYPESVVARAGWHLADTAAPIGPGTWEAARRAADCAVAAADALLAGADAAYALCRPPGHHACADMGGGHCFLNNSAIAAERLRGRHGRVAVLDVDVHHGNGTQSIFYARPDVLTVSVHADPHGFYPFFVGHAHERGEGAGEGFNLNLPLPLGADDAPWLAAIEAGMARVAAFAPGAVVLALGLDAHERDPLRGLAVTTEGFAAAGRLLAGLPAPVAMVQEGGYLSDDLPANLAAFLGGFLAARRAAGGVDS
ncbi:MAG: histone deacetylase family protein [Rhodobacteraceae bacterium]|nr:MAG: histone deacetylase family protein [Paracoccaceae bacterium]